MFPKFSCNFITHFVNSLWLQHSSSSLLWEGDFSASRCLPGGYASLLRNTSMSHTSCGQTHRSVLRKWDSEGGAGGGKQTENWGRAALCAALLELKLIRYEAISEQASVSCERSHQRLHWESHQIFYSRPLWTQTNSPPSFPHSSTHINTEIGWKINENSVLFKPAAAAAWSTDRNVLLTYFALCVLAEGWKL